MKVVVLTTHTNNTPILYSALSEGRDVSSFVYDHMSSFDLLPEVVSDINPDWVLYIGAIPAYHRLPVPAIDDLKAISYKKVHLCCDGSDDAWWPLLREYYNHNVFDLQINIDGALNGPIGQNGLTTIAPIDPEAFGNSVPLWPERRILCGFAGAIMGGNRADTLRELVGNRSIVHRQRDSNHHSSYIDWLKDCCVIWNHPETGSTKSQHVKARVIEAALAGCLVLEKEGSPLRQWFEPGHDYLEWRDVEDVATLLQEIKCNWPAMENMAGMMRRKLLAKYPVNKFWTDVERIIGVRAKECAA